MPQEQIISASAPDCFYDLFDELKALCLDVPPEGAYTEPSILSLVFDELKAQFGKEYKCLNKASEVLFGPASDNFGAQATEVFLQWEDGDGCVSLPALIAHAITAFDLDVGLPEVKAVFLSSVLAEIPNSLRYHGNEHYRKVLFHAIRLISTHNRLAAGTDDVLSGHEIALLLAASCIHDLGHEGGDNMRDGVYTPGYMEQHAYDLARPYYEALGMDSDSCGEIESMVFCTDITFFAGENSPCVRLKKIYRYMFWGEDNDDVLMMMVGKLRRYADNPKLVLMAMFLHEADIASSAGMSYEWTIRETIKFMEERGMRSAGPKVVLAFLREQLGETMFTDAAKQLYGPVMSAVVEQAEADKRETYYE
ncbi:MAG: hypothetical protein H6868_05860 [Rhodospirillales bacterium]|nr:hypothetical protein [Rhodospirillales bacterium]